MRFILILFVLALSCGEDETIYIKKPADSYDDNQNQDDTQDDKKLEFSGEVIAAISRNCKSCHANDAFIKDPALFKQKGQPMISSGEMPPGGNISQSDKTLLIEF